MNVERLNFRNFLFYIIFLPGLRPATSHAQPQNKESLSIKLYKVNLIRKIYLFYDPLKIYIICNRSCVAYCIICINKHKNNFSPAKGALEIFS